LDADWNDHDCARKKKRKKGEKPGVPTRGKEKLSCELHKSFIFRWEHQGEVRRGGGEREKRGLDLGMLPAVLEDNTTKPRERGKVGAVNLKLGEKRDSPRRSPNLYLGGGGEGKKKKGGVRKVGIKT